MDWKTVPIKCLIIQLHFFFRYIQTFILFYLFILLFMQKVPSLFNVVYLINSFYPYLPKLFWIKMLLY